MSEQNEIFSRSAAGLFPSEGDIHIEDLYQAFKARLVEELEGDAKRYQWLRHDYSYQDILLYRSTGEGYLPRGEELDAAIDKAIAEEQR